jgi:hypothetical protein
MDAEAIDVPLIEAVLPRNGATTRGDPGEGSDVQVLAANVDTVWDSGAVP